MLEANRNFGMAPDQITILQQEKVASLDDADGHISRAANDKYCINTKPHGHGDVHFLLYSSGVAKKWRDEGKQYGAARFQTESCTRGCHWIPRMFT
jgi:UDP-sugar pyrophosphorylase